MRPDFWEPEAELDIPRRHRRGLLPEKRKKKVCGEEQGKGGNGDVGGLKEPYRAGYLGRSVCRISAISSNEVVFQRISMKDIVSELFTHDSMSACLYCVCNALEVFSIYSFVEFKLTW
jgi:hypothetical protein